MNCGTKTSDKAWPIWHCHFITFKVFIDFNWNSAVCSCIEILTNKMLHHYDQYTFVLACQSIFPITSIYAQQCVREHCYMPWMLSQLAKTLSTHDICHIKAVLSNDTCKQTWKTQIVGFEQIVKSLVTQSYCKAWCCLHSLLIWIRYESVYLISYQSIHADDKRLILRGLLSRYHCYPLP